VTEPKASSDRAPAGPRPIRLDRADSIKLAAIDIGSNAVRLLLAKVSEDADQVRIDKEAWFRMPIRLGEDTFVDQRIGQDKASRLVEILQGFERLIAAYRPAASLACATAALREADNAATLVARIRVEAGIDVRVIDGLEEARILMANHRSGPSPDQESVLCVDVGGGSCDLTAIPSTSPPVHRSYRIGTVRLLRGRVAESEWKALEAWLGRIRREHRPTSAIGSGGNIHAIFQLARQTPGRPLGVGKFRRIQRQIEDSTLEQRTHILGLKPDRADVIEPAGRIYLAVMRWAGIQRIHAPQVGLADGLIRTLFRQVGPRGLDPTEPAR
jgi:exopolyphosphatase/guanosine-5'-triphosphate,3'-diphosphate pyrophosphatase